MRLTRSAVLASALALAAAPAGATAAPVQDDGTEYAQREAHDPQVARFEGGSVVVITASGGALLVLLFLLYFGRT